MENVSRLERVRVSLRSQPTFVRVLALVLMSIAAGFVLRFNGALAVLAWLVLAVAIISALVWVFIGLLRNSKRSSLIFKIIVATSLTFVMSLASLGAHALGTTLATTAAPYSAGEIADQERQAAERAEREAQEAAEKAEREAQEAAEKAKKERDKAGREAQQAAEKAKQEPDKTAEQAKREREKSSAAPAAGATSDAKPRERSGGGFSWKWPWASDDILVVGSILVPPQYVAYAGDGTYDSDAKILEGADCDASAGFDDIGSGGQVVVTDSNGSVLGVGVLSGGTQVRSGLTKQFVVASRNLYGSNPSICKFSFSFEVPGGKKLYSLSVGNVFRGEVVYTEEELALGVALELGP